MYERNTACPAEPCDSSRCIIGHSSDGGYEIFDGFSIILTSAAAEIFKVPL